MQKAGAYLKSVREEKGRTIQEISKSTKISAPVLRALEEGRIDNVDPVYLKGFLKLYCRYLGLNWEVFISEYPIPALAKKQQKYSAVKPTASPAGKVVPKKGGLSFLKLISANRKFIAMILALIAVVLLAALIFRGIVFIVRKLPKTESPKIAGARHAVPLRPEKPKAPEPAKVIKASPAKKSVSLAPEKVPVPAPVAKAVGAPLALPAGRQVGAQDKKPKEITLAIRAQEDSFITLKVDGKIVYQRMMYKGKAETWSAKTKIELSVGNAGGLSLEVNGKPILPLGKKGQQIKNILITSDGLKVL